MSTDSAKKRNANLKSFKKGDGRSLGRKKGVPNKVSLMMKEAMIFAAENCRHSKDKSLQGFFIAVANKDPVSYAHMMTKLLPLTINARNTVTQKVVYRTVVEIRAALIAKGMSAAMLDRMLLSPPPVPVAALTDEEKFIRDRDASLNKEFLR